MFLLFIHILHFRVCNVIKIKTSAPKVEVAFFENFGNEHCAFYEIFIIIT